MLKARFTPSSWLAKSAAAGIVLILTSAVTMLQASPRDMLHPPELNGSRGGDQDFFSGPFNCDFLQVPPGFAPCKNIGQACQTCSVVTYTDVNGMKGGGLNAGGVAKSCGNIYNGVCAEPKKGVPLRCVLSPFGDTKAACSAGALPPTQQP